MQVRIRLFATLKDRVGKPEIEITLGLPAPVSSLLEAVTAVYPALSPALPTTLVAVNKAFASPTTLIQPGDEIALFPPVSGGNRFPYPTYFAISEAPPDIAAIHGRLLTPQIGAIATFTGFVRGQTQRENQPANTLYLEYEAYSEMAESKMAQIAQEIWQKWPLVQGIAIVQRVGKLDVSDITTFVACASGHRDQGIFEAAHYGIDRLKEIVPVWKKEVGPNESVWVEGNYRPTEKDNH